jgi:hypothetical protein
VSVRHCKRSRCGFAGQSGSVPSRDLPAECRKRMSPCRRKCCTPTKLLQEPLLSNFARLVFNTAPLDPMLELPCPPPASRNGPRGQILISCQRFIVAALQQTDGSVFRLRDLPAPPRQPWRVNSSETVQGSSAPTKVHGCMDSRRRGAVKRGLSTINANRAACQRSAAGCRNLDRHWDPGRYRCNTQP